LASSTKKEKGKARSSLGLLFFFIVSRIIVLIIIAIIFIAVPCPRVFHSRRRKRRIDCRLRVHKTHGSAHFTLALLQM
jgi:hypothetical protein